MKIRHVLLVFSVLCGVCSIAQSPIEKMMLFIELKDGNTTSHVLEDYPEITFNDGHLTVTDPSNTAVYSIVDVDHFFFKKATVNSIEDISTDEIRTQWIDNDILRIYSENPHDLSIGVYSLNGSKMNPDISFGQDYIDISLKEFVPDIYIITFNNQSIKMLKK